MSGAKSRNKGATFERRIANQLTEWSGQPFHRTKFSDGPGTDTPDIITPPGFRPVIECKNREGWTWDATIQGKGPVWHWWGQAERQAASPWPWLILTRNRQPVYLVLGEPASGAMLADHATFDYLARVSGMGCVFLLSDVLEVTDYEWWCV